MDGIGKYIELWDGLIIELGANIQSVSAYTDSADNEKMVIVYKDRIIPQVYSFGADSESRDAKYKEIKDILVKLSS